MLFIPRLFVVYKYKSSLVAASLLRFELINSDYYREPDIFKIELDFFSCIPGLLSLSIDLA